VAAAVVEKLLKNFTKRCELSLRLFLLCLLVAKGLSGIRSVG